MPKQELGNEFTRRLYVKNCQHCGCGDIALITIRMRIGGREVEFQRCSACEANTWLVDADVSSLDRVLEFARAHSLVAH